MIFNNKDLNLRLINEIAALKATIKSMSKHIEDLRNRCKYYEQTYGQSKEETKNEQE